MAPDADYTGPKRALILAGGGMRVAYHAGALRAMMEAGLRFSHVDGTSGGIINAAMVLSGLTPEEMCDRWRTLDVRHFASLLPLEKYIQVTHLPAMGDADLIHAIAQYLDFEPLEKQALLECHGLLARAAALIDLLEIKAYGAHNPSPIARH